MDAKKMYSPVAAGLIVLGTIMGCAAPQPQAAPRAPASTPAFILAQPIATPTVRAGGPTVANKSFNPRDHPVRRNVKLEHSNQNYQFDADVLPTDMPMNPVTSKGISKIVTLIIEPRVSLNGNAVTTFSPPLAITVDFDAADSTGAPRTADGKPRLVLITSWKQGNVWKWEKLATTVTCTDKECTRGTLTAEITNLRPNDPVSEGWD